MATALRLIDGRHGAQAIGPTVPVRVKGTPGLLARLTMTAWLTLNRLHALRRAVMERLPLEYSFWTCH